MVYTVLHTKDHIGYIIVYYIYNVTQSLPGQKSGKTQRYARPPGRKFGKTQRYARPPGRKSRKTQSYAKPPGQKSWKTPFRKACGPEV